MKKMYIAPAVEINETMAANMMALSLLPGFAEEDKPTLGKVENSWNLWGEENDDEE